MVVNGYRWPLDEARSLQLPPVTGYVTGGFSTGQSLIFTQEKSIE